MYCSYEEAFLDMLNCQWTTFIYAHNRTMDESSPPQQRHCISLQFYATCTYLVPMQPTKTYKPLSLLTQRTSFHHSSQVGSFTGQSKLSLNSLEFAMVPYSVFSGQPKIRATCPHWNRTSVTYQNPCPLRAMRVAVDAIDSRLLPRLATPPA